MAYAVIAIALVCCLYPRHSWKTYRNVNEQARLYLVKAVVEEGVLNIDKGIETYGDLQDKATKDGHFYCDKPVGLSVLAVPVYFVLYHVGQIFGVEWTLQAMRYTLTILCVTLPTIGLLFVIDRYWWRMGAPEWLAGLGLVAYALGTIACTYSTQFLGHQLAAVLAFAHFALSRDFEGRVPSWKLLAAGGLAGLGAITDYFSAIVHLIIIASYVTKIRPVTSWAPFLAGGVITFAPLPIYNYFAFGGVARMSYGQEALPVFKELHGTGFFGVTLPRPESIHGLLISPAKGLFWLSPFLLLGIAGLAAAVRDRGKRRDGIVMAAAVAVIMWLALSVHDWRAGWTVGPRHMVSMLPFLATGAVLCVLRWPRLASALAVAGALSVALVFVPTMTLPAFDVNFPFPITQQALFLLKEGIVSPNPGLRLGIPGAWSLALPALLAAGAFVFALAGARRARARLDLVAAVGAIVVLAAGAWFVSSLEKPLPEPMALYFQARVLKQVDAAARAGAVFERAVAITGYPAVRREVADHCYPEAAMAYSDVSDYASMARVYDTWKSIDPGNPKLGQLGTALQGHR
jgi:hypothetical protein